MGKPMNQQQREEHLNDFVDALIMECKPVPPVHMSQEMAEIFETVRGVRRLRDEKELLNLYAPDYSGEEALDQNRSLSPGARFMALHKGIRWAAAAAAVFLMAGTLGVYQQITRSSDELVAMESADEAPAVMRATESADFSSMPLADVAYAYGQLKNYQGVLEIRYEMTDSAWKEVVEITYAKPDQFYTVTRMEDETRFTRIYDGGEQLISFHGDGRQGVMVDPMSPEMLHMHLKEYHVGSLLDEIMAAAEIREREPERVNGRNTLVLEYRYEIGSPYHRVWVDEELMLPVRLEMNYPNGDRVVREFTELAVDIPLDENTFAFDLSQVNDVYYAQREESGMDGSKKESDDAFFAALEESAPESPEMHIMDAADLSEGTAVITNVLDSYYVEVRWLDQPVHPHEFKLNDALRERLEENPLQPGVLIKAAFEYTEDGPMFTYLEAVHQVELEGIYNGLVDSSFAEFTLQGMPHVMSLDQTVKEKLETLAHNQEISEGTTVKITVQASEYSTGGKVVQLELI